MLSLCCQGMEISLDINRKDGIQRLMNTTYKLTKKKIKEFHLQKNKKCGTVALVTSKILFHTYSPVRKTNNRHSELPCAMDFLSGLLFSEPGCVLKLFWVKKLEPFFVFLEMNQRLARGMFSDNPQLWMHAFPDVLVFLNCQ